jgi:hypothetical protein
MCFGAYTLTPHLFSSLGVLACLDGYMNIAMEQTEEFVDGQLKAKYGDCFIRGNNGECNLQYYKSGDWGICIVMSFVLTLYIQSQCFTFRVKSENE